MGSATTSRSATAAGSALRAYGEELAAAGAAQRGGAFTDDRAADAFVKSRPEAFVIGVLFTQGIPAERAWAGPYLLAQRLGHFDLARLAAHPDAVSAAVAAPPALHRFVHTVPGWIVSAARRIDGEWGGDAASIWSAGTSLSQVVERLRAFDGIGPKKAVMASEILLRHFGAELTDVECGSVAYDVHVRRVFLRTGLVDRDTPEEIRAAAAVACPGSPGVLDLATWLVGRESCHPREPRCETCRLGGVCLRLTERSADGVGVRRGRSGRSGSDRGEP
ncbi:MAG: hypothetical protein JW733_05920 [Coriobacteriia bacterium]|nr:hypothetical protein [Coriobacteriia bacterium]MBN2839539.1 hypothetical protein [Coriobacteriia bacterium]